MKKFDFRKAKRKSLLPHIERKKREKNGYIKGDLICRICNSKNASINRQRTNYANDIDNIDTLCPICQKEADAHWDDMWAGYYSSIGI